MLVVSSFTFHPLFLLGIVIIVIIILNCDYLNLQVLPFSLLLLIPPARLGGSKQMAVWYSVAGWG